MNGLNLIEEERGLETHFKALRYKESVPYLVKDIYILLQITNTVLQLSVESLN